MKKSRVFVFIIALALILTSCTPKYEKAMKYMDDEEFDKAIELFDQMLDEDEMNYEAWFGKVEALIEDEEFEDAEDVMQDLLEVIEDNYDLDDEEVDYEDIVDDFMGYAEDILDEAEEIGDWYYELMPQSVYLDDLNYQTFGVGEVLQLPIPENGEVHYNLKGSKVKDSDEVYKDGIELTEAGDYELMVAVFNSLGMKGVETTAYITVADLPKAPLLTMESGTYEGPVTLYFEGYDSTKGDIYFSLDGTDPLTGNYNYYWHSDGIMLYAGEYTLRAIYYEYNSSMYSPETIIKLTITGEADPYGYDYGSDNYGESGFTQPVEIDLGIYNVKDAVYSEVEWTANDIMFYDGNITINLIDIESPDQLMIMAAAGELPDVVYTQAANMTLLQGAIQPVTDFVDLNSYDYFDSVLPSTSYYGNYYCLPVTVKPSEILYYNYYDTNAYYDNGISWDDLILEASDSVSDYKFSFQPGSLSFLLSAYLGFGGNIITNELGHVSLDAQALTQTLSYIKDLSATYGLSGSLTVEEYADTLYNGTSGFLVASPALYYTDNFSWDYEPAGQLPLNNGSYAKPLAQVEGLLINSSLSSSSDEARLVRKLYETLASDGYYNSYIAGADYSMPANKAMLENFGYYTLFEIGYYQQIIEDSAPTPVELIDAVTRYGLDLSEPLNNVINGTVTPEQGAQMIIAFLSLLN